MEHPRETASLIEVVQNDTEYVICNTEGINLTHNPERKMIAELSLALGDVIHVKTWHPEKGLVFTTRKHPNGQVLISPQESEKILVEIDK